MATADTPWAVIGAGSWGTALAIQFARAGHPVRLWGRDPAQQAAMAQVRCNARYLPDAPFPPGLEAVATLDQALDGALDVLVAVPSHALRAVLHTLAPRLLPGSRVAWATKGFELETGLLPHQVAREVLGTDRPMAVLSGPTFAREVGSGLKTAMTVASADEAFATSLANDLSAGQFRAYISTDMVGVEVGGAVDEDVADAVEMLDDRHRRFARDALDERFAAPRDCDVDVLAQLAAWLGFNFLNSLEPSALHKRALGFQVLGQDLGKLGADVSENVVGSERKEGFKGRDVGAHLDDVLECLFRFVLEILRALWEHENCKKPCWHISLCKVLGMLWRVATNLAKRPGSCSLDVILRLINQGILKRSNTL